MTSADHDTGTVDSRGRILAEAIRLFGKNGYEGTSLQAIADAVGIRKQSLFHHFKSKADLWQSVLADLLSHWQRELPRILAGASSGHDRFSSTVSALVNFFLEDAHRAKMVIREMLDRPDEARRLIAEELKPWTALVVNHIRMGQETGLIKKEVDPQSYIVLVIMMAVGTVALGPVISAFNESGDLQNIQPKVDELVRVARESLFA